MTRKMLFFVFVVIIFSISVLVWFFMYASPSKTSPISEPGTSSRFRDFPKRFNFILGNEEGETQTSTTEVTFATPQILTEVWGGPASGQMFVTRELLREVVGTSTIQKTSTSTKATTTEIVTTKKAIRATSTVLMFVDRTTGHIHGFSLETNKTYQITNTTIPGIHDAYIFDDGKKILMRYADQEKNIIVATLATIPQVTQGQDPKPLEEISYLPSQVTSVAVSHNAKELSYLVANDTGVAIYTIANNKSTFIGNSPFKEWTLFYGGTSLYAYSNPSAYVEGYVVKLPSFEIVTPARTGLMSNASPRNLWLHTMWSDRGLVTYISNTRKDTILSFKTLASKCVWVSTGGLICAVPTSIPRGSEGLPDDWFQGRVSFTDNLVLVDETEYKEVPLYSFSSGKPQDFDITQLKLSTDDTLLAFTRKQNGSLWLLNRSLMSNTEAAQ